MLWFTTRRTGMGRSTKKWIVIHKEMYRDPQRKYGMYRDPRDVSMLGSRYILLDSRSMRKQRSMDRCTFMDRLKQGSVLHNYRDYRDGEIHVSRVSRVSRHRVTRDKPMRDLAFISPFDSAWIVTLSFVICPE